MEYEIELEFDRIIDNVCKGQSLSLKDYLQSVQDCGEREFGCDSQTTRLYNEYRFDCEAWKENLEIVTGLKMGDIYEKWENVPNSKIDKWIIVAGMFDEYCHDMLEMMLMLEKINEL